MAVVFICVSLCLFLSSLLGFQLASHLHTTLRHPLERERGFPSHDKHFAEALFHSSFMTSSCLRFDFSEFITEKQSHFLNEQLWRSGKHGALATFKSVVWIRSGPKFFFFFWFFLHFPSTYSPIRWAWKKANKKINSQVSRYHMGL